MNMIPKYQKLTPHRQQSGAHDTAQLSAGSGRHARGGRARTGLASDVAACPLQDPRGARHVRAAAAACRG